MVCERAKPVSSGQEALGDAPPAVAEGPRDQVDCWHRPGDVLTSILTAPGTSRPGSAVPILRPVRTVPRDVRPWQDAASARARARELAPKIHAARRRVIAHHEAGHLIVAAHVGVMVDEVSVEVARRFSIGAVHLEPESRGRPQLALATILAAGGE